MTDIVATYRLQLNKDFTFADVQAVSFYLKSLNISHLYLSPVLESVTGSNHGYDVTDFTRVSSERGGEEKLRTLLHAINPHLKVIIDIVPNHMAASLENPYWHDVLKNGKDSAFWGLFDLHPDHDGKISLPVFAETLDEAIERNILKIVSDENEFSLSYGDMLFPLKQVTQDMSVREAISRQAYRLTKWTDTKQSIGYRRFFNVGSLVGVRVENKGIFNLTHQKTFSLLEEFPNIEGVRVDHIDGLALPGEYLQRLSERTPSIWIEKILAQGETLPDWPIRGTTGYEFIECINHLLTDRKGFGVITSYWNASINSTYPDFGACLHQCKIEILDELFPAELTDVAALLDPENVEQARQFLFMLTCVFPAYRIYGSDSRAIFHDAITTAGKMYGDRFNVLATTYAERLIAPVGDNEIKASIAWQQLTGPAMAKGLEDRAHYRYTPLVSYNEVGCTPEGGTEGKAAFLDFMRYKNEHLPDSFNTTSTHDTKRSEDVRCRLYALADMPETWISFCDRIMSMTAGAAQGVPKPTQYFFWQAVVGSWPLNDHADNNYILRLSSYMEKAAMEENIHLAPEKDDPVYKERLQRYIEAALTDQHVIAEVSAFNKRLSPAGAINSLSMLAIKCLSIGSPDIYQGQEGWDFSLVDPDNRRPVDYQRLMALLETHSDFENMCRNWRDGRIKSWLTRKLLQIRKDHLCGEKVLDITAASLSDDMHGYILHMTEKAILVVHPLYPGGLDFSDDFLSVNTRKDTDVTLPKMFSTAMDMLTDRDMPVADIKNVLLRDFPIGIYLLK